MKEDCVQTIELVLAVFVNTRIIEEAMVATYQ